ncbi:hypothetical protein MLD38_009712 [Melastoma candidum]|uniref:Uncharacterized protein n=1 Tax=Melastoma candidum TaxID=119954 RepID=A0ACB9S6Y8_9MYRT|nr:hypothetical protein MLD38_009712 [Melastoma candidum]
MGKKKQAHPRRSGGLVIQCPDQGKESFVLEEGSSSRGLTDNKGGADSVDEPLYVDVQRSSWELQEHLDVSEVVLTDLNVRKDFIGVSIDGSFYTNNNYYFRFKVVNISDFSGRIKLGHWPLVPCHDITLELVEKQSLEGGESRTVALSGKFDGPDNGISGIVHLASLQFISLRPHGKVIDVNTSSLRVRVEILGCAFDECASLVDNARQVWKKSMMNAMAWLRPEVTTSEVIYGTCGLPIDTEAGAHLALDTSTKEGTDSPKRVKFDVSGFYEAIKPPKESLMLDWAIPDLLPELRPYQRRAAHWMVQRENGVSRSLGYPGTMHMKYPLCVPVTFIDSASTMFYNPFSGNVSMHPEVLSTDVAGGILADEMGLGKTVELLACILTHRSPAREGHAYVDDDVQVTDDHKIRIRRLKRERVECTCGAVTESWRYKGLWVQCDVCDAWQHSECVGYSPRGRKISDSTEPEQRPEKEVEGKKHKRKRSAPTIIEREGKYICSMCSELRSATDAPIASGATLIVCPAPILHQWHAEIIRHTNPGSVRILVYEGVKNASFMGEPALQVNELVNFDIVLTSYDVLKDDLSHDSDRHEGDRRLMRYQKRYPVIPTPLTRIFWRRICLDEAQMVESSTAAATEMAMRLHSKYRWCVTGTPIQRRLDDLYGLLKYLKLHPFNVFRWWAEVIRDPYENGDAAAMEFTHNLFKIIMWRSSKMHVADELQIPLQEECVSWLSFSPIEEHFYQRQHETCVDYARELLDNLRSDILKRDVLGNLHATPSDCFITHADAAKLLNSLLKLRQACCHPQVGSSGLRTLQQSPMTMEEILMVLISKTKVEGEEALRRLVVALNALAALAIIEDNLCQAVSLYKEALQLSSEYSEDFSLDPLLSIHVHYNLSDILLKASHGQRETVDTEVNFGSCNTNPLKRPAIDMSDDLPAMKREKLNESTEDGCLSTPSETCDLAIDLSGDILNQKTTCNVDPPSLPSYSYHDTLRTTCEDVKQKYLTVFKSRLITAQQEFKKAHEQVNDLFTEMKHQSSVWWLEVIDNVEGAKDSSEELIRKIGEAILGSTNNSRSSKLGSSFRSISGIKYYVQTGLDSLETSRRTVLDRLLEIDLTMDSPRKEEIDKVGHCQNCQPDGQGPICILCELDDLFKIYEARLFRLSNVRGGVVISPEEALESQKKKSALNQFYRSLAQSKTNSSSSTKDEKAIGKRDTGEQVVVSKSPSELEIILGVIKGYSKFYLGKENRMAASKQLRLLEDMRKEYAVARSLCVAQAQVLRAHDEIKMSTSRLRLREDENDKSIDALSIDELPANNVHYSNEKFLSLALLSSIRGKLRYLKGLVLEKHKSPEENLSWPSETQDSTRCRATPTDHKNQNMLNLLQEACPICQEKLSTQRMVFQCGHATCCKCFFMMTEHKLSHVEDFQKKWLMCPTCRQHTDFANIAFADDRQNNSSTSVDNKSREDTTESSITVQGSYGTKIEAVTRRILWIKYTEPSAKVLVFSSWNDVLDVLEHALDANGITYTRMKGGRKSHAAISLFRGDEANAKSNSKVQEAQAISRVHRIGQEKGTLVHRFMVKDSVEESIYKLNKSRNSSLFISGNTKNQDQPILTLKDIELLFATAPATKADKDENGGESLMHLPPSMAAAVAAERRLKEQSSSTCLDTARP